MSSTCDSVCKSAPTVDSSTTQQKCVCSCCCSGAIGEILDRLKYLTSSMERTEAMVHVIYEEGVDEDDDEDGEDVRESATDDEQDLKRPDTPPTKEDLDFIDDTPQQHPPRQKQRQQKQTQTATTSTSSTTRTKKRRIVDDDENEY